ncbi:hypothetical protein Nham_0320 [Nitrobacter hamburgensis X14]|uniref:Uncharacterized protein n=1 Tax=Nitrobacter hamburgensis (strain DSM 10229 / NCIMB 13809 / X14) TaxID=323097 RepID=Q1QRD1_NITHX|nr:hypothetical protein [Nitrobacter hamburgensis]ABE61216.1 hypothetical protein Nham_0320 [Nitrobacter hamburgensis X14]
MVFRAQIKDDGKFDFGSDYNLARFKAWCKEHPGKWVRIEEQVSVRSLSQHNFYWVYLGFVSHETGHTPEELHEWAKKKFLPRKFATVFGEEVAVTPTTKTLTKLAFGEYLERICAETGVPLPNPQEAGYLPH